MTDWFDLTDDDERAVVAFMSRVGNLRTPDPESRIPNPGTLWCKAQLLKQWDAERRAQLPIDVMHRIEIVGGLVAAGVLVYFSLAG